MIDRIQNKSLCLHNILVYIYIYMCVCVYIRGGTYRVPNHKVYGANSKWK